jgi:acyl-CoA synthetase (NDP forming)
VSQYTLEATAKALLKAHGIPIPVGILVNSPGQAREAAEKLGFPLVAKVSHPTIQHKTEVNGVAANITNTKMASQETNRLLAIRNDAQVLLEQQAPDGLDLICGCQRDPLFGPVVLVGMGGIFAEVLKDTALFAGLPTQTEALSLLDRLKGAPLLHGTRGQPPVNLAAIAQVLVNLSQLLHDNPAISTIEVNPLRTWPDRVLALDALAIYDTGTQSVNSDLLTSQRCRCSCEGAVSGACGMEVQSKLCNFFAPRSVAIVGASTKAHRAGNIMIDNLKTLGYQGHVYPVNPTGSVVDGLPAYPSVTACPEPVDLAVLAIPYSQVQPVMEDLHRAGCRSVIVVSGGFSDAGPDGKAREQHLVSWCQERDIRLMGPNSIGTLDAKARFTTSIGTLPGLRPSGISVFGQSGTLTTGFALEAETVHKVGFARMACLGNKPDVDESDLLEFLGQDDETQVIGMYLESVKDGPRFMEAARVAARNKPVVVLKSGRTSVGAAAAASHTGALAGEDAVFDAVFRQAGAVRVDSLPELFATLRTFDLCPLPAGPRLGIVSLTGVGCVLAADACQKAGLELPRLATATVAHLADFVPEWAPISNPADIWSTIEQLGPEESFRRFTRAFLNDPGIDLVLVISVLLQEGAFNIGAMLAPLLAAHPDKPVLAAYVGGRADLLDDFRSTCAAASVPVFESPAAAVRTAGHLWQRRKWLRNLEQ